MKGWPVGTKRDTEQLKSFRKLHRHTLPTVYLYFDRYFMCFQSLQGLVETTKTTVGRTESSRSHRNTLPEPPSCLPLGRFVCYLMTHKYTSRQTNVHTA